MLISGVCCREQLGINSVTLETVITICAIKFVDEIINVKIRLALPNPVIVLTWQRYIHNNLTREGLL